MSRFASLISIRCLCVGLVAIGLSGCGGSSIKAGRKAGQVTGSITLNDQPLTSGVVCLNDEVDGDTALGTIGPDGKFAVKYKLGTQVPTGKYRITVAPAPLAEQPSPDELMKNPAKYKAATVNPIPLKYRGPKTTDLTAEVKEGVNTLTLALTGKS